MEMTIGVRRRIAKQTQRRAELTPETMIVALDLGKRQHAVWVTDSTRIPMGTWMMPATPQGFATLFDRTARLQQQFERPHVLHRLWTGARTIAWSNHCRCGGLEKNNGTPGRRATGWMRN